MPYSFQSIYFDCNIVNGRVIDIFMPEKITREKALFFVHGGGWQAGSRTDYHKLMRAFNERGFICAATDYRLNGVTILDQITDVRHGYDLFMSVLAREGKARKIFTYGSSAGAHLAALLTLTMPGECGEDVVYGEYFLKNAWLRPVGAALQSTPVVFEPWEDIFPPIWSAMQGIAGVPYEQQPDSYRKLSPINHLSEQTPPIFFLEAENEHMFPLEHTVTFIARAKSYKCRAEYKLYPKTEHGFFYDVTRRQQKEAFSDILSFIESLDSDGLKKVFYEPPERRNAMNKER